MQYNFFFMVILILKKHFISYYILLYSTLGKYQIQSRQKEQLYTKDKTALNVILSNCTKAWTGGRYVYGDSIFP